MVRKIFCLSLALMLVALAVPAMASTCLWVETPAADGAVNLRSGPGTEYPVIGWAVYGDELVLLFYGEPVVSGANRKKWQDRLYEQGIHLLR